MTASLLDYHNHLVIIPNFIQLNQLTLYCLYAVYITATQILYCNYPINKRFWPIMSVIFGKVLYLIPKKKAS